MDVSLAERAYLFELEWKDRLYRQAVFTSTLGAIYFPILSRVIVDIDIDDTASALSFLFMVISTASGIVFLVRFFSFFGNQYFYVDDFSNVYKIFKEAEDYDKTYPEGKAVALHTEDLMGSFCRSAAANRKTNQRKARVLLDANRAVFFSILTAAFAYFLRYVWI